MGQYWKCRVCGGWLTAAFGSWMFVHESFRAVTHRPDPVRVI